MSLASRGARPRLTARSRSWRQAARALAAAAQFFLYGLGMGFVVVLLTAGISLFKGAMSGALRRALPFMQRVSAALMLVAGGYIVFYWLTFGELL